MTEFVSGNPVRQGTDFAANQRYDRQIRVWGAEAQFRLQNAKVLICGLHNVNIEVSSLHMLCIWLYHYSCRW
jgi:hypothetical protein